MSKDNKNPDVSRRRFATGAAAAAVAGFFGSGNLSYADTQANTEYYYIAVEYLVGDKISYRPTTLDREDPRYKVKAASPIPLESEGRNRYYGLKLREMSVFEVASVDDFDVLEPIDYNNYHQSETSLVYWVSRLRGGMNIPRDFYHFMRHRVSASDWILTFQAEGRSYRKYEWCENWLKGWYTAYSDVGQYDGIVLGRQSYRLALDEKGSFTLSNVNAEPLDLKYSPSKSVKGKLANTSANVKNDGLELQMAARVDQKTGQLTCDAAVSFDEGLRLSAVSAEGSLTGGALAFSLEEREDHVVGPLALHMDFSKVSYLGLIGLDGKPTTKLPDGMENPYSHSEEISG